MLRADPVTDNHVDWSVSVVAYLGLAFAFLTFVAGFVTPLGLGEGISAVGERTMDFAYAPDLSSFGRNTQQRSDMPLSRDCVNDVFLCPGAIVPDYFVGKGYNTTINPNASATTSIPSNITKLFSSATKDSTVANIFEIQYRSWKKKTNDFFDDKEPYVAGVYRGVDNLIPRENITIAEGVVADMESGGIGFRNHTLPSGLTDGASWDEDLLWLEPDTSCVNTNLSLEVVLGDTSESAIFPVDKLELVDDGGFADLRHGNPFDDWPNLTYADPDVRIRADRAAWFHNVLFAMILNLTDAQSYEYGLNTTRGRHYPLDAKGSLAEDISPLSIFTNILDIGSMLDLPDVDMRDDGNLTNSDGRTLYPLEDYPYERALYLNRGLSTRCSGATNSGLLNENDYDSNVNCGYFLGFPSRVDGGSPLEEETGSKWKLPLNVCAGSVKASIKSVSFAINGSDSATELGITKVRSKSYTDSASHPLWAFEDRRFPGYEGARMAPLWGLVDDSYEGTKGYNFSRRPDLYLPHTEPISTWGSNAPRDSLAGTAAPLGVLSDLFSSAFNPYSERTTQYRGSNNLVLRSKWSSLSSTSGGAELILRLVWTDIMASATVGTSTRGIPSSFGDGENRGNPGVVTIYQRKITYDMKYAIPAIILLAIWLLVIIAAFVSGVIHRHILPHMRQLINDTSVGRVGAVAAGDPNARVYIRSTTQEWLGAIGHVRFRLGGNPYPPMTPGSYDLVRAYEPQTGERSVSDDNMNKESVGVTKQSLHDPLLT